MYTNVTMEGLSVEPWTERNVIFRWIFNWHSAVVRNYKKGQ